MVILVIPLPVRWLEVDTDEMVGMKKVNIVGLPWKSDGRSTDAPVNVSEGSSVYVSTMTSRSSRS